MTRTPTPTETTAPAVEEAPPAGAAVPPEFAQYVEGLVRGWPPPAPPDPALVRGPGWRNVPPPPSAPLAAERALWLGRRAAHRDGQAAWAQEYEAASAEQAAAVAAAARVEEHLAELSEARDRAAQLRLALDASWERGERPAESDEDDLAAAERRVRFLERGTSALQALAAEAREAADRQRERDTSAEGVRRREAAALARDAARDGALAAAWAALVPYLRAVGEAEAVAEAWPGGR